MRTKKEILKKYVGKGGPTSIRTPNLVGPKLPASQGNPGGFLPPKPIPKPYPGPTPPPKYPGPGVLPGENQPNGEPYATQEEYNIFQQGMNKQLAAAGYAEVDSSGPEGQKRWATREKWIADYLAKNPRPILKPQPKPIDPGWHLPGYPKPWPGPRPIPNPIIKPPYLGGPHPHPGPKLPPKYKLFSGLPERRGWGETIPGMMYPAVEGPENPGRERRNPQKGGTKYNSQPTKNIKSKLKQNYINSLKYKG